MTAEQTGDGRGRVAMVTGASGGLGGETARVLDAKGYRVALHYQNNRESALAVQRDLQNESLVIRADVTQWSDVTAAVAEANRALGLVDVLVNCAGTRADGLMATQGPGEWRGVVEVNLVGTFHACRAVVPRMMQRRWGRIINVVSPAAMIGSPGQTAYSASKAGVVGMTRSLALECGRRGVTVNALSPGFMETRMTSDVHEELRNSLIDRLALRRFAEPTEIAAAVGFIVDCDYMTGQTITIDGGLGV